MKGIMNSKRLLDWLDAAEITENDVMNLISFYNDCATVMGFPYKGIRPKGTKPLKDHPWYKDAFQLVRIINKMGAKPRDFIMAQFHYFKKVKLKRVNSRDIPTLHTMLEPSAVDKWRNYLQYIGKELPLAKKITKEEMKMFNIKRMRHLMDKYNIKDEEDFFKDPILISQLSKTFVESHESFNKLVSDQYYEKKFGMKLEELFYK